jgi:ribose transport system substrate-binding protein
MRIRRKSIAAALAVAALTIPVAACGSDDDGASASPGTATAAVTAPATTDTSAIPAYDGPEASLPTTFTEPTKKEGFTFTIGVPVPSKAVPALSAQLEAVEEEAKRLGGKVISTDANFSIQKQVSDFQQLLSQDVDAIILSALDPNSLTPLLKQAEKQGVPVFVNDVPYKAGLPPVEGISASSLSGSDQSGYARARYIAEQKPGAKFGLIGVAIPAPMLDYMVSQPKEWGEKFGLEYVDRIDAKGDGPEAGAEAANALLAKNPDIEVIFVATDSLALGAASAARSSGRDDVLVVGNGGWGRF